ncbi:hypothetical protein N7447_002571 [Penicillium robsamsonii]|uniref:uncharacterized protein n=1 Tax=Penicillium robsamsonii TaxID=1792511 RepID=UPI00254726DF|nr:uncharacterized protein N7447_002571 [Penicillium robsamsonii]KAJ5836545.1 hypothetical protein N7447_002571 [Penicillium robsamsonii]
MSTETPPPLVARMLAMFEPAQIMTWAMSHYIRVCAEAVFKNGQLFAPITQTRRLRDEAFGRFWIDFTYPNQTTTTALRQMSSDPNNTEIPEPVGSSALIPPLLRTASGIVLDIGPGTGTQMPLLTSPAITALYGAEPCEGLHSSIREKAEAESISSKYHIVPTGVAAGELIPALRATGTGVVDAYDSDARAGIFDTILCVRVLCSVPEMERTVGELYGMLKPGGRLLVTEHVVNPWRRAKGSLVGRIVQGIYQILGWRWFLGDCCLDRDTEAVLRAAADVDGGWESVELERAFEWSVMPYISGVLVKKGQ